MRVTAVTLCLLAALALAMALGGCTPGLAQDGDGGEPVTWLALGDSYTVGEGLADDGDRWPVQLAERLRADGHDIAAPRIIARTGWTTRDLLRALRREDGRYDIVTLMIGVNDQYQRRSKDRFRADLKALLRTCVACVGGTAANVVVVSIPDWGATPFARGRDRDAIAADIDAFNDILRAEVAAVDGLRLVDVTPLSRDLARDRANLTADGLHYSAAGCAAYADAVRPAVLATPALQPAGAAADNQSDPDNRSGTRDGASDNEPGR